MRVWALVAALLLAACGKEIFQFLETHFQVDSSIANTLGLMKPGHYDKLEKAELAVHEAVAVVESQERKLAGTGKQFPALINGQIADTETDYKASVWIGNCTAAIAGPRTLLTAAHCTRSRVSFKKFGKTYQGTCRTSRLYNGNQTADWSICYLNEEVTGMEYEKVNLEPAHVAVGDKILQSGFGCTKWGTRLDGKYRVGKSEVLRVPQGSDYDYVTGRGEEGEAVICSGDSGGPAWSFAEDGFTRDKLVSVNSRSNTRTRSYLSSFANDGFKALLASYQQEFNTPVCGVNGYEQGCRNGKPIDPPKPQNQFAVDHEWLMLSVKMKEGKEALLNAFQVALEVRLVEKEKP